MWVHRFKNWKKKIRHCVGMLACSIIQVHYAVTLQALKLNHKWWFLLKIRIRIQFMGASLHSVPFWNLYMKSASIFLVFCRKWDLFISLLSVQNSSTVIMFGCRITRFMMRDLLDQQQLGTGQAHFSMLRDLRECLEVTDITILQVNTITHGLLTITDQARFVSTNDMIDNHYGSRHGGLNIEPEKGIFWILVSTCAWFFQLDCECVLCCHSVVLPLNIFSIH